MGEPIPDLQIFYGISSPWAYFGAQKAVAIARDNGARVRLRPIRIIEANGGIPLRKRPDARQLYHEVELRRWREFLGMPLNLKPKFYPCRTIEPAAQAVIALQNAGLDAISFSFAVQRALWSEDRDIADLETLRAIALATAGADAAALVVDPQPDAIVEEWHGNLAEAERFGIFGTPTYVLGKELFWGQDRLDFVDRALKTGRETTDALKEPA
ncbi:2-hydroxychromene-2-carboxylate isomerase [Neorhizobium sp. 2083]|uniref:2-hydroxychromene-2-carboxylate isomerase n=1 Tax=Neorhizobium sp. 2083 TaxID=2817762 RepID=UPI00285B4D31|nr:2-hydroxychromene-2-carboxylate isomerase [Neorhizobium sp. 2083]MDR6820907.1 2-hydroxychromene-2-carboxylate isomerase [Neorhizobium sp. 2083]